MHGRRNSGLKVCFHPKSGSSLHLQLKARQGALADVVLLISHFSSHTTLISSSLTIGLSLLCMCVGRGTG